MEPWLSWTLAVGIGTGLVLYYRGSSKVATIKPAQDPPQTSAPRRRQDKKQRQGDETLEGVAAAVTGLVGTATSSSKPRKSTKQQDKSKPASTLAMPQPAVDDTGDDDMDDDKTWAEQLNAAKQGVNLHAAGKSNNAPKAKGNKKKQRAEEGSDKNSWPSDDGKSLPVESSSQDVSDMLEAPAPGPSVLRLTGEEKAKKQTVKTPQPEQETKKQRQNRRKAEEKKAQREADEDTRKVLQENQRRTAREARGEPARNGLPAPPPASQAWSGAAASTQSNGTLRPADSQLLDTFDHDAQSATSSDGRHTTSTAPATARSALGNHHQGGEVPAGNENSGWSEVGKSKKSKKKTPGQTTPPLEPLVKDLNTYSTAATDELVNGETPAPGLPVKNTKPANSFELLDSTASASKPGQKRHPLDSDWAAE